MRPALADAADRARADARVMQSALDGRHLPPYLPGEPRGLAAAIVAARIAPILVDAVRETHGIERWSRHAYEEVFLGEAMRAWRPDLEVAHGRNVIVTASRLCPVASGAARDARVCDACQAVQREAARQALGTRAGDVRFPMLLARGDRACEMRVELR